MRRHFRDEDHLYAHLLRGMADDWENGGPVRVICAGWEDAPRGSVIQLRLLAGLFRIVLTGRAPELAQFYPCLGGTSDPADAWQAVRPVMASHIDELRAALTLAPQTNEVGRSNALLVGVFVAVARTGLTRVRLLEPGASAGLNLLVDRFRFVNEGWVFGPGESPVLLSGGILGDVQPVEFGIVDRRGCDPAPVDIAMASGRLRLRSFVWPFHVERHERLSAAFQVAERLPPAVDKASAGPWLADRLAEAASEGVLTVVWQSITRQYWPADEWACVDEVVRRAGQRSAVAHVCMEYPRHPGAAGAELTVGWADGSTGQAWHEELVGTVGDHGFPVRVNLPV